MAAYYQLVIHTGDQATAGTDSNIFVILHGERGSTDEIRLNGFIAGDAFERNKTDTCTIPFNDDVGDIYRITVRSDERYAASDWLLGRIEVRAVVDAAKGIYRPTSVFHINSWIKDDKPHTFDVTDGFNRNLRIRDEWVIVDGAPQYIIDNSDGTAVQEQKISVEQKWTTSLVFEKNRATSISTKTSVEGKFDVIKTALETQFKEELGTKATAGAAAEMSIKHEYVLRIGPGEPGRVLVEKWAEKRRMLDFELGDTAVPDVFALVEKRFVGLADPVSDKVVMKADSGLPILESAADATPLAAI